MGFKEFAKSTVNPLLNAAGVRLVNCKWGPRGFLRSLVEARDSGISLKHVVDVGAAQGTWTMECLEAFPDSEYLLIDPLQENEPFLKELTVINPRSKYWIGAAGAEEGEMSFHVHGDQSSFYGSEYSVSATAELRSVPVQTLDHLSGRFLSAKPDLIKIDVQGFELGVLAGATEILKDAQLLLIEVSYQRIYKGGALAHEVINRISELGYRIYDICTYSQRPKDGKLAQSDIIFAKEDSILFSCDGWD